MKAYKFRTIQNLDLVIDILLNKRLYCSDVHSLNDIREADIRVGKDHGREKEILYLGLEVQRLMKGLRVCSLCKTFDNQLLWAYYAGGSSGLAIEVELPEDDVIEVIYDDEFIYLSEHKAPDNTEELARRILSRKYADWHHEQEVRIITNSTFYSLTAGISRVIVGSKTNQTIIDSLALICEPQGITVDRAVVADWGIYTVGAQTFNDTRVAKKASGEKP